MRRLLLGALASLSLATARADQFDYSFAFDTNGKDPQNYAGTTITGSFAGTLNGGFVGDLSNISYTFGPFTRENLLSNQQSNSSLAPVISFNSALTNFDFYNDSTNSWFYLDPTDGAAAVANSMGGLGADGSIANGTWTLTDVSNPAANPPSDPPAPVGDGGSTIVMLGLGIGSLALMYRKFRRFGDVARTN
jgi:hypothetical protein